MLPPRDGIMKPRYAGRGPYHSNWESWCETRSLIEGVTDGRVPGLPNDILTSQECEASTFNGYYTAVILPPTALLLTKGSKSSKKGSGASTIRQAFLIFLTTTLTGRTSSDVLSCCTSKAITGTSRRWGPVGAGSPSSTKKPPRRVNWLFDFLTDMEPCCPEPFGGLRRRMAIWNSVNSVCARGRSWMILVRL
ncbi:hypothetical protein K432DRAFT_111017 [Lepidopterella palustris CBS 459.81]|uniref:Uncharacterized protein n=1 Tax=Lepidopterella palustris CBS 459.81 TaxID=1314670 RepID=A0A8E2EMJ3_9PEZI|nr:hypothetical protein K432DRAFT_111017 [Lepidopterella palustris CBS 459.81]